MLLGAQKKRMAKLFGERPDAVLCDQIINGEKKK